MGLFTNIFLLYACISLSMVFYSPEMVLGDSPQAQNVLTFFGTSINNSTEPVFDSKFNNASSGFGTDDAEDRLLGEGRTTDRDSTAVTNIFLSVIDPVWNALMYIVLFFRVLFSPAIVLTAIGAPYYIVFTIGYPLVFLGFVSIIAMIRGYN